MPRQIKNMFYVNTLYLLYKIQLLKKGDLTERSCGQQLFYALSFAGLQRQLKKERNNDDGYPNKNGG